MSIAKIAWREKNYLAKKPFGTRNHIGVENRLNPEISYKAKIPYKSAFLESVSFGFGIPVGNANVLTMIADIIANIARQNHSEKVTISLP